MTRRKGLRNVSHVPKSANGAVPDPRPEQVGSAMGGKLTHFLCIPLVTASSKPSLVTSLNAFRNEVRRQGVSEAAVRPVGTLHLTIGVMSLSTGDTIEAACQALKQLDVKALLGSDGTDRETKDSLATESSRSPTTMITTALPTTGILPAVSTHAKSPGKPLEISLRSLRCMRDMKSTSVLYAYPDNPSRALMPMCEKLQTAFTDAGFLRPDDRALKLHATIWNGIYVKHAVSGRRKNASRNIDATSLLDTFKDTLWTDAFELEKIAICEMRARDVLDEGGIVIDQEYKEVCSVPLPGTKMAE